jgi:signal transduction histidine kinase
MELVPRAPRLDVKDCLLEGLRAHGGGEDALLAGLSRARRGLGARRALWVSVDRDRAPVALVTESSSERLDEVPAGVSSRWLEETPPGRARLLGPDWMRRDPRTLAEGLDWALVARSSRSAGLVWIESTRPLDAGEGYGGELLRALEHLDALDRQRREARAREVLVALAERSGGVAHDLRNQLSLVQLEVHRLQTEHGLSAPELGRALEEALDLCRGFLARGGTQERPTVDLRRLLVEEIEAASRISGRNGEVRVRLRCPADRAAPAPERLRRVTRNLVLNAIGASARGSEVRVEALEAEGGGLRLTIRDQGRGMARSDLELLLSAGESRGGTGFGTTSVLDCLRSLGAELEVESTPGGGTTFEVLLPPA